MNLINNFRKTISKRKKNRKENSLWAVFKLLFFMTINDWISLIMILVIPILISVGWMITLHETKINGYPNMIFANDPVNFLWYPFVIFSISFVGFFYVAIKFNSFKNTILFKKILIGGINKLKIVLVIFVFYFLITLTIVVVKISMLIYYPLFREEIKNANLPALIGGFLLLIVTNIFMGIFFSSLSTKTTFIAIGGFFFMIFLLFFQGFIFDIEILVFVLTKKGELTKDIIEEKWVVANNWMDISYEEKILRWVRFLNPYQPSFNIIRQAHLNSDWVVPQKIVDVSELGIDVSRPMVYDNYWLPIMLNSFWIIIFGQWSEFLLNKNR